MKKYIFLYLIIILSCNRRLISDYSVDKPSKKNIYQKYELDLLSSDSVAKSLITGTVKKVYNFIGEDYLVLQKDSLEFVVSNLKKIYVSTGDSISKYQNLGVMGYSPLKKKYYLTLKIFHKGKSFHFYNIERILNNKSIKQDLTFKDVGNSY